MKPMKKLEMINKIYEKIMYPDYSRWKTLALWCCMIWDVLSRIDNNSNWIDNLDWQQSRDMEKHKKLIIAIYYMYLPRHTLPIEEQSEECIKFIYNLIK